MSDQAPSPYPPGPAPSPVRDFFTGPGLPAFILAAVVGYEAFLAAILLTPPADGFWGGFVRDFKVWCFSYDARTGGMSWASAWVMLLEPAFVAGLALLLGRRTLAAVRSRADRLRLARPVGAGLAAAALVAAGLLAYGRPPGDEAPLPFPGQRIRTALLPPAVELRDQHGQPFRLSDLRGQAVLVTGIYAQCSTTCPEILIEVRRLLESLPTPERARLRVAALTLNPEYETADLMQAVAAGYGYAYPEFRYLNGPPAAMHDLLARLGFSLSRDPRTGIISHANLFLLLDREGRIAYRLTLDPRHRPWLREALLELTREAALPP